ncbi:MAG TPA: transcriptional regulator, partial [Maribacter sp.]|nr:transcriptional regulator [Maribacter sp.]
TSVCYCIDKENWASMKDIMTHFLDQDISNNNCC